MCGEGCWSAVGAIACTAISSSASFENNPGFSSSETEEAEEEEDAEENWEDNSEAEEQGEEPLSEGLVGDVIKLEERWGNPRGCLVRNFVEKEHEEADEYADGL